MTKQETKDRLDARRRAALAVLEPQWKACKKQKPRGHIFDGDGRSYCIWCGYYSLSDYAKVEKLERMALDADTYPIARDSEKLSYA